MSAVAFAATCAAAIAVVAIAFVAGCTYGYALGVADEGERCAEELDAERGRCMSILGWVDENYGVELEWDWRGRRWVVSRRGSRTKEACHED